MSKSFCRELALGEPLIGTAPEATRWVFVEAAGRWGPKVPAESDLPDALKQWLLALERPTAGTGTQSATRIGLVRPPLRSSGRVRPEGIRTVILAATPDQPDQRRVVRLELDDAGILGLDVDAALAATTDTEPLWLVCTHASRDACCAKWGMPIFDRLRTVRPDRVWQCSHLGGHRFAPTIVCLPFGLMWGRTSPDEAAAIDEGLGNGMLEGVGGLRGRSCWPPIVQAGECLVRLAEPRAQPIDWLEVEGITAVGTDHQVDFRVRGSGESRACRVGSVDVAPSPASCSEAPTPRRGLALHQVP